MPGTLNNRLILRDKYIRDTALSEGDLKEQLVEARAQLAVAVAALKAVEFVPHHDCYGKTWWECEWCHKLTPAGEVGTHFENCQRQAALRLCEGGDNV